MTANLDQALEPGETIVFRTRGRTLAGYAVCYSPALLAFISLVTMFLTMSDLDPDTWFQSWFVLSAICTTGFIVVMLILQWVQDRNPDDCAVTDQRLLFANSDWDDKLESLNLSQIDEVCWIARFGIRHLTVRGNGKAIELPHLRMGDIAARRIAEAAGRAAPPELSTIAIADPYIHAIFPASLAAYVALRPALDSIGLNAFGNAPDFDQGIWWRLTISGLMGFVAFLFGDQIAGPLALIVMRPFLTGEQARAAICAGNADEWHTRIALRWASLLYRRPLTYLARSAADPLVEGSNTTGNAT